MRCDIYRSSCFVCVRRRSEAVAFLESCLFLVESVNGNFFLLTAAAAGERESGMICRRSSFFGGGGVSHTEFSSRQVLLLKEK